MCGRLIHLTLCLSLSLLAIGCGQRHSTTLPSSSPSDVARINVRWEDPTIDFQSDDPPVEVWFAVDPRDYESFLALFDHGHADANVIGWVLVGDVSITYKNGQTTKIGLFHTGEHTGAYRIEGSTFFAFRGASDAAIATVINNARKRVEEAGEPVDRTATMDTERKVEVPETNTP